MLKLELTVKRLEMREANSESCKAVYNVYFEGKVLLRDGREKEPVLRGIRVFASDLEEGRLYIRLPQIRLRNAAYMDILLLPGTLFEKFQELILEHFKVHQTELSHKSLERNIEEVFKNL